MGKSLSIIAITIQVYHINKVNSKMNYRKEPMADDHPLPPSLEHLRHLFHRTVPVQEPDNPQRTSRNLLMDRHRHTGHTDPDDGTAGRFGERRHNHRSTADHDGFHARNARLTANGWDDSDARHSHRLGGGMTVDDIPASMASHRLGGGGSAADASDAFTTRTHYSHSGAGGSSSSSHTADPDTSAYARRTRMDDHDEVVNPVHAYTHEYNRRTAEINRRIFRHPDVHDVHTDPAVTDAFTRRTHSHASSTADAADIDSSRVIPPKSIHMDEVIKPFEGKGKGKGKGKGGSKPDFSYLDEIGGAFGGSSAGGLDHMYGGRHSMPASVITDFVHGTGQSGSGSKSAGSGAATGGSGTYKSFPLSTVTKSAVELNDYAPKRRKIPISLEGVNTNDYPYSSDLTASHPVVYHAMGADIFDQSKGLIPDSQFEQANNGNYFPFFFSRVGDSAEGACRAQVKALGGNPQHGESIVQAIYVKEYNEWALKESGSKWPQLYVMEVDTGKHLVPEGNKRMKQRHLQYQQQSSDIEEPQDFQIPPKFIEKATIPNQQLKTIRRDQIQFERQQRPLVTASIVGA